MRKKYEESRPHIPADLQRSIKVGAGHSCTVRFCNEHYAEIHHIDGNRENNDPENLIYLCDKHHKMAHEGKIDRKSLRLYKENNNTSASPALRDTKAFQHFLSYHPHNGLISRLRNESFQGLISNSFSDEIHSASAFKDDPRVNFKDAELQKHLDAFIMSLHYLSRAVAVNTGRPISGADHYEVPKESGTDCYYAHLNELKKATDNACAAYDSLYSVAIDKGIDG